MFRSKRLTVALVLVLSVGMAINSYTAFAGGKKIKKKCQGVPKTGQTTWYAEGDDGWYAEGEDEDLQIGIPWPDPRFTDNGDRTVTDNLTGLMWTKSAQEIPEDMSWNDAITACNNLVINDYDDWRMPNVRELYSLIDYGNHNPALPDGHPFADLVYPPDYFWSSTTYAGLTSEAFIVEFTWGTVVGFQPKTYLLKVWPVRSGD